MLIYYVLIIMWYLLYLLIKGNSTYNRKRKFLYAFIAGGLLFLVMGLRDTSVGTDTNQYLYAYNYVSPEKISLDLLKLDEWGFHGMNTLLKQLNLGDQAYILVVSFIISVSFSLFFYKHSKNIFLSFYLHLTIGLFTMSLSGIRQTIAICFILLAFNFILNKKNGGFFISVFLAYTFHNSAFIFLPVYFLKNIIVNKKNGIILLTLVSSMLFLRKVISPIIEIFAPEKYLNRYGLISDTYHVNPLLIIIAMAIPATCIFFWNRIDNFEKSEKELFSILFVLSCVNAFVNILSLNSNMIGRLSFYFIPFNSVLIPNVISIIKNKKLKIIAIFLCIILPFIQFAISTPGGSLHIDQYRFIWE